MNKMRQTKAGWYKERYNATLRVENTPGGRLAQMVKNEQKQRP